MSGRVGFLVGILFVLPGLAPQLFASNHQLGLRASSEHELLRAFEATLTGRSWRGALVRGPDALLVEEYQRDPPALRQTDEFRFEKAVPPVRSITVTIGGETYLIDAQGTVVQRVPAGGSVDSLSIVLPYLTVLRDEIERGRIDVRNVDAHSYRLRVPSGVFGQRPGFASVTVTRGKVSKVEFRTRLNKRPATTLTLSQFGRVPQILPPQLS